AFWLLLEREAERLEHVGRAAGRGDGAVAVLRNGGPGRRGDERRCGGDIDRVRAVTAGTGRVDQVVALRPHREHVRAHRLRAARDLGGGFALRAERDQETPDL